METFCVSNNDPLNSLLALDPLQRFFYFSLKSMTVIQQLRPPNIIHGYI